MNTGIEFLEQLGADLVALAERESHHGPARRRRRPSVKFVAAGSAAVLVVAGLVGYFVPRLVPDRHVMQARQLPLGPAYGPLQRRVDSTAQAPARPPLSSDVGPTGGVPLVGPRIVKTASTSIVVKRGTFMRAFGQASAIAGDHGGFVQSSSTGGSPARYGTLEIRVPASLFTQTLSALEGLGTVESQSVSGEDVTAKYMDLQARIGTWQSQERALLRLMAKATTIGQTLSIQSRLQDVQLTIEQLKGQLRVLQDQTATATISVTLREAGVRAPVQRPQSLNPSFGRGWRRAVAGFLGVIVTILIGLGYLIPIAAGGALIWGVSRRLRRRVLA